MKKGDHIYISYIHKLTDFPYTHHGIYCGSGKVIHYYKGKIRITSLSKFGRESKTHVKGYKKCYSSSRVVKRAKSRLGEQLYNLVFNNCEHFAYWCKTGKHTSKQVESTPEKVPKELHKKFKKLRKIKSPKRRKVKLRNIRVKVPFV